MCIIFRRIHTQLPPGLLLGFLLNVTCTATEAQVFSRFEPPDAWRVKHLPGQTGRVFTLYGCPGNLDEAKRLIAHMKAIGLGNGFDPGPTTVAANAALYRYFAEIHWPVVGYPPYGGEFQVKHRRAQLTDADEAALQVMDDSSAFMAIQLGECLT